MRQTWETEFVTGSSEFARKCVTNGIAHPAGNCYQDLGWAARPKVRGEHIRFVSWREYIAKVVDRPKKQWRFSQEDILSTLPWGERTLQTLAQQVSYAVLPHGGAWDEARLSRESCCWNEPLLGQLMDGRKIRQLDVRRSTEGRYEIGLAMPRFGIRTICCELQPARG